jgi:hypothetical protein
MPMGRRGNGEGSITRHRIEENLKKLKSALIKAEKRKE